MVLVPYVSLEAGHQEVDAKKDLVWPLLWGSLWGYLELLGAKFCIWSNHW